MINTKIKFKLLACCLFILPFASKVNAQVDGAQLFDDSFLHEVKFTNIDTSAFLANKNYQMVEVSIDGTVVDSIGLKRKGNISGYPSTNKFPMKVKTNKYVSGKKYDGIKEFTLHMNYQDPSLLREKMTYDICAEMGLNGIRTAFAKVYFDNIYWGLYTLVEGKDEFYKQRYDNRDMDAIESIDFGTMCFISNTPSDYDVDQNGGNPTYELENGDPSTAWPRFATMIDKTNNTADADYLTEVQKYLNLQDFFTYQAVNVYLLNFDSYIRFRGNQIYAYDTITNVWQVVPWDFNASFGLWDTGADSPDAYPLLPSDVTSGCIASKMNSIPELKTYYMEAMCKLVHEVSETSKMHNLIDAWDTQIKQAVYDDTRKNITDANYNDGVGQGYQSIFGENVPGMKTFITERNQFLLQEIADEGYTCLSTTNVAEVKNAIEEKMIAYPNPAKSVVNLTSNFEFNHILIFDLQGRLVLKKSNIGANSVAIENLNAGTYIVQTEGQQKVHQLRVIIR